MNAQALAQEVIAGNMAAGNIPGFKKQEISFSSFDPEKAQTAGSVGIPKGAVSVNFSQGEMRSTSVQTDLALQGPGFFEVQLPSGATAYTRDGEFKLDSTGQLVTKHGHLVMSETGPVQFDRNIAGSIHITADGEISQGGVSRGKLKLAEFADPKQLRHLSGGLFTPADPTIQPLDSTNTRVQQGYLEAANTSPAVEMTNLIAVMRAFEANQRLVQVHDERMGKVISELGNPA